MDVAPWVYKWLGWMDGWMLIIFKKLPVMVVGWTGGRGAVGLKLAWQNCAVCEAKQILIAAFSS